MTNDAYMIEGPPEISDDDLDESFKSNQEKRRQQERIDKAVPNAVVEERKDWEERLANQKQEHWTQIILFCVIVAALVWIFLTQ